MAAKKNKKTAEKKEPKKTAPRKAAKKADAKKAPAKKAAKKGGAKKGVGKGCTVKRCAGVVAKAAKSGSEQSKQTVAEAKIPCPPKKPAKKKGKKAGAKKAAAKKPAAKKAAKKAPKKAAKKAKKPKAPQRVAESRMAARVAKGLGVSQDTAESVLKAGKSSVLKEGETGPGLRSRKAPDKSKEVKSRTVSRKQAIATVAHYMNVSQKEAEAFLNANSNLVNDSGSKRFLNPLPEDLQRVNNPNFTAGQTAVAVITTGVAFTLADIVDRIVATRKVGDCEFHGIAADQKILQRPGALRLGIQAGVSVLGFGGAWFAGKKDMPMTQAILGGVATGFGIKFVSDVMIKWALPKVFSAKQDEKKLGTRIYANYQDDVQKQLDDTLKAVDEKCKAKDTAGANQVLRAHRLRALGLSTSNETTPANRQIGVAGAPAGQQGRTSPQPGPRPAPKAYKETPVGVAGAPVRGEPVARPAATAQTAAQTAAQHAAQARAAIPVPGGKANEQVGVDGCRTGGCGSATTNPVTQKTQRALAEVEALAVWFNLGEKSWHDKSFAKLADGTMPEEDRQRALKDGALWFHKPSRRFLSADMTDIGGDQAQAHAVAATPAPAPAAVATPAPAPAAEPVAAPAPARVNNLVEVPQGKTAKLARGSDGKDYVRFVDEDNETAAKAAPAPAPAPAPVAEMSPEVAASLHAIKSLLEANSARLEALEVARAAAPVAAPVVAPAPTQVHIVEERPLGESRAKSQTETTEVPAQDPLGLGSNRNRNPRGSRAQRSLLS